MKRYQLVYHQQAQVSQLHWMRPLWLAVWQRRFLHVLLKRVISAMTNINKFGL